MRLFRIAAASLLALLAACESDPCNKSNCFVLASSCQSRLAAEPEYDRCREVTGIDARFDASRWCVAVCQAWGAERVMECVVREQSACLSPEKGTTPDAVLVDRCGGVLPRWRPDCWNDCEKTRRGCEDACPESDFFCLRRLRRVVRQRIRELPARLPEALISRTPWPRRAS